MAQSLQVTNQAAPALPSAPASTVSTVQGAAARQGRSEAALVRGPGVPMTSEGLVVI